MPLVLEIHVKPAFYFNIFSGDLHFDALIIELCYICLISKLLEKVKFFLIDGDTLN